MLTHKGAKMSRFQEDLFACAASHGPIQGWYHPGVARAMRGAPNEVRYLLETATMAVSRDERSFFLDNVQEEFETA